MTHFFDLKRILVAILSTPVLVTKIHQDKSWPIHLLDLMCPQDLDSGDGLDSELTKVADKGNDNQLVDNAFDQELKQSRVEGEAGDQPDPNANPLHQDQLMKEMYTKMEKFISWTVDNKVEDAKANIIYKLEGKRMRERSTSAGKKRAKRNPIKRIYFDPAQPSKKPVFPDFLTEAYMYSNLDSVVH